MVEPVHVVVVSLQVTVLAVLAESVRRSNVAAAVNALVALLAAVAIAVVAFVAPAAFGWRVEVGPALPLWFSVAAVLHVVGMTGLYESVWWWDHITHAVSSALVAALLYAGVLVGGVAGGPTASTAGAVTLVLTIAVGVVWELVELVARDVGEHLDVEPVLVHYGWRDTAYDLVFDVVGALVVVGLDLRTFVPLAEQFPGATRWLVLWSAGVALGGTVVFALYAGGQAGVWPRTQ